MTSVTCRQTSKQKEGGEAKGTITEADRSVSRRCEGMMNTSNIESLAVQRGGDTAVQRTAVF